MEIHDTEESLIATVVSRSGNSGSWSFVPNGRFEGFPVRVLPAVWTSETGTEPTFRAELTTFIEGGARGPPASLDNVEEHEGRRYFPAVGGGDTHTGVLQQQEAPRGIYGARHSGPGGDPSGWMPAAGAAAVVGPVSPFDDSLPISVAVAVDQMAAAPGIRTTGGAGGGSLFTTPSARRIPSLVERSSSAGFLARDGSIPGRAREASFPSFRMARGSSHSFGQSHSESSSMHDSAPPPLPSPVGTPSVSRLMDVNSRLEEDGVSAGLPPPAVLRKQLRGGRALQQPSAPDALSARGATQSVEVEGSMRYGRNHTMEYAAREEDPGAEFSPAYGADESLAEEAPPRRSSFFSRVFGKVYHPRLSSSSSGTRGEPAAGSGVGVAGISLDAKSDGDVRTAGVSAHGSSAASGDTMVRRTNAAMEERRRTNAIARGLRPRMRTRILWGVESQQEAAAAAASEEPAGASPRSPGAMAATFPAPTAPPLPPPTAPQYPAGAGGYDHSLYRDQDSLIPAGGTVPLSRPSTIGWPQAGQQQAVQQQVGQQQAWQQQAVQAGQQQAWQQQAWQQQQAVQAGQQQAWQQQALQQQALQQPMGMPQRGASALLVDTACADTPPSSYESMSMSGLLGSRVHAPAIRGRAQPGEGEEAVSEQEAIGVRGEPPTYDQPGALRSPIDGHHGALDPRFRDWDAWGDEAHFSAMAVGGGAPPSAVHGPHTSEGSTPQSGELLDARRTTRPRAAGASPLRRTSHHSSTATMWFGDRDRTLPEVEGGESEEKAAGGMMEVSPAYEYDHPVALGSRRIPEGGVWGHEEGYSPMPTGIVAPGMNGSTCGTIAREPRMPGNGRREGGMPLHEELRQHLNTRGPTPPMRWVKVQPMGRETLDEVCFSFLSPRSVLAEHKFQLKVYAYLPQLRDEILQLAMFEGEVEAGLPGGRSLLRGKQVTVKLVRRAGWGGEGGEGGGVYSIEEMYPISCMAVVVWPQTLASLQCRDGACRVFADQADIACTKREAP